VHGVTFKNPQILPQRVEGRARPSARQVMDTAVKSVTLALPGGAITAGFVMLLENPRVIAVQSRVAPGCKTRYARADNDDGAFRQIISPLACRW